ncbi:adrenocortical dysplasia protein homolog isoform X2 [Hoplias malabaricus]|uniref:adrenocortical dysplasia protein homolog isoform X2 n=1 Tax=Hoplias malabaricus TaxID=27720 RepID=UPI0034634B5B
MRRYRGAELEPEPWVELLVQNYGQKQRDISLRAHVVSNLTDSMQMDESSVCMLFLSDGTVFIPAVLSTAAWERLQDLEEREDFSGLDNTTVSVRKFQLNFYMDTELTSCQFYLTVDQIISIGRVTKHYHPPSCTTLPSVKQQILKTWRSLMKECSANSMNSQSGITLSCLMGAWHNDIIMDMLNDAIVKITTPIEYHPCVATPTHWHRERLRYRGEVCFSAPVSHLLIPEEHRELLTADPGASSGSETQSGLVPPHIDTEIKHPITAPDQKRDLLTVAIDGSSDLELPTLDHTRPEICCSRGEESGEGTSPWDIFCPAPDLLGTPSSSSETSMECLSQDSETLLTKAPQVPMATSTQAQSSNHSMDEKLRSGFTPYQRPHPYLQNSISLSEKNTTDQSHEEQQGQLSVSPPTWVTKNVALCTQDISPMDIGLKSPPTVSPSAKKEHTDGSGFYYIYEPCPQVVSAFSKYRVPEQLMQWAVTYLGTPEHTLVSNSRTEQRQKYTKGKV